MTRRTGVANVLFIGLLLCILTCKPPPQKSAQTIQSSETTTVGTPSDLGGTSWQLVKFQGSDGTSLRPDDPAKYTLAFGTDGRLSARIDCNRGNSTWKSPAPSQLELGPLALTRAMCPSGSLHNQIVKQWPYVRST